ncbi:TlpA family protein disulfide reductase [Sinorhizobium meliloti]|uniref:TlpA family protein disulfide reductase n=1 Tax=Rhizobium meliloti TaxID=382 RepID=UPI001F1E2A22|nr:thioredoxin family protein [Sinorhizobium meliloti]
MVVDVWASWCPTCAAQEPIIEKLTSSPEFSSVTVFKVAFDKQKDVVQALGPQRRSTLI